jgi:hypothetical protein
MQSKNTNTIHRLSEANWNYHIGKEHDGKTPYLSDPKSVMGSRDTGHFGSGTYFASYHDMGEYGDSLRSSEPNFIQIGGRLYRVDLDFYKNLYRVHSEKHGNILYSFLYHLNKMYSKAINDQMFRAPANYTNYEL